MTLKRALFLTACGPLLLTIIACQPASDNMEDSEAELLMSNAGKGGAPGFTPQGWGWKPGSSVEISLFNEPDSQGKPNPSWKKIRCPPDLPTGMLFLPPRGLMRRGFTLSRLPGVR